MLHFLFAVGQFVCLFGLLFVLLLVITKAHRNQRSTAQAAEKTPTASQPQPTAEKRKAVHEETFATIRVVPIENSRLLNARKATENHKDGISAEPRKPSRRRTLSATEAEARAEERAVLLIKNARKKPDSDRPRAI